MNPTQFFIKECETLTKSVPRNFNKQDWEDAVQESFITVFKNNKDIKYKTYIKNAIKCKIITIIQAKKSSRARDEKFYVESENKQINPEEALVDIQEKIERAGQIYKIKVAISQLPVKQKMIMESVMSGLTVTEFARAKNLNINTTKHNYLVALRNIKNKIGAAW